jgi:hypothetical protein
MDYVNHRFSPDGLVVRHIEAIDAIASYAVPALGETLTIKLKTATF